MCAQLVLWIVDTRPPEMYIFQAVSSEGTLGVPRACKVAVPRARKVAPLCTSWAPRFGLLSLRLDVRARQPQKRVVEFFKRFWLPFVFLRILSRFRDFQNPMAGHCSAA